MYVYKECDIYVCAIEYVGPYTPADVWIMKVTTLTGMHDCNLHIRDPCDYTNWQAVPSRQGRTGQTGVLSVQVE